MISGLTQAHIREHTTTESFSRGQTYYKSGAVRSVVQRGREVVAQVAGSSYEPYRVHVTVDETGITGARCSCPYDWGGWCKHIVAVLLACLHDPDTVAQRPSLESRLQELSQEQLIALIRRMIERHDDLELLVELAAAAPGRTVDTERIRTQVRHAFGSAGYDWRASYGIAMDLEQILETGDAYAGQGAWHNVAAVYQAVLESIIDGYETIHDEEGEIAGVAGACAEQLGACLAEIDDAVAREGLLRALFETYAWDVNLGGYGISDGVPAAIQEQATPEERRLVAQWIRDALPPGNPREDDFSRKWRREKIGGFLLDLEKDELDDAAYLQRCRETGRWNDLITRLLERGRADEAVEEAGQVQDRDLLALADVFKKHRQADRIEAVIRQRVQPGEGWLFIPWLKEQAEKRGDDEEALHLGEQLFWKHPTVDRYAEVKRLAQKQGQEERVRAAIEDRLLQEEAYALLTQLHLFEHDVTEALRWLDRAQQKAGRSAGWRYPSTHQLALEVARAAEESHPVEAVRLYRQAAEHLIDQRGRSNYAAAAQHLARVREIYRRLGRADDWERAIREVREQHRNLPALKDELNKAGL